MAWIRSISAGWSEITGRLLGLLHSVQALVYIYDLPRLHRADLPRKHFRRTLVGTLCFWVLSMEWVVEVLTTGIGEKIMSATTINWVPLIVMMRLGEWPMNARCEFDS